MVSWRIWVCLATFLNAMACSAQAAASAPHRHGAEIEGMSVGTRMRTPLPDSDNKKVVIHGHLNNRECCQKVPAGCAEELLIRAACCCSASVPTPRARFSSAALAHAVGDRMAATRPM